MRGKRFILKIFSQVVKQQLILTGGIGNQIFIVFEAFRRQMGQRSQINLNVAEYQMFPREDRPLVISDLLMDLNQYIQFSRGRGALLRYWITRGAHRFFSKETATAQTVRDELFSISFFALIKTCMGYFQYFDGSTVEDEALKLMKSLFSKRAPPRENKILAIHARRGDYLKEAHKSYGVVYFRSAGGGSEACD